MALTEAWRELHVTRFAELPLDCGNCVDAGIIYSEDLRDWSDKATTPDQARMERYIDRYDLRTKRILHIGVGNSALARRFHNRVREIVGTTIDEPEIRVARALSIPNYSCILHNKYSGRDTDISGKFDFILDNNPTSPCCCIRHLADLFSFYATKLNPSGMVVTDLGGLQWVPAGSSARWRFDFDDLSAAAATAGIRAYYGTRKVFLLSREQPPAPSPKSLLAHLARRTRLLPGQLLRHGPPIIAGVAQRAAASLVGRKGVGQ